MMHKRGAMLRQHLVVVIASALMVAFGQIAWGAELLTKTPPAPIASPAASWNGFYVDICRKRGVASGRRVHEHSKGKWRFHCWRPGRFQLHGHASCSHRH